MLVNYKVKPNAQDLIANPDSESGCKYYRKPLKNTVVKQGFIQQDINPCVKQHGTPG